MSIFIVMVGGIGAIEGAIIGALIYFFADRMFGEFGSAYLIVLGLLTLIIALYARGGVWGLLQKLGEHPWFPVRRKLIVED
jgi:branched-chain amino acid transport system permease protein